MLKSVVNLFFPKLCTACREPLVTGQEIICTACRMQLPYLNSPLNNENPVAKVFWGRVPLEHAGALFYYKKNSIVQALLHDFKYKNNDEIGKIFGKEMSNVLQKNQASFTAVVPVPLHPKKLKKRGYNQSEVLSTVIAEELKIPVLKDLLRKQSDTSTQTKKNRNDRWDNTAEKFVLGNTPVSGHVLLVDDVITTGATLDFCANLIRKAYPDTKISVMAMAYTYR